MVGTRSRLIRVRTSDGHVRWSVCDGSCTPARPASPVWNASVDVLCRTRRNADALSGAAPDVTPAKVRSRFARERVPTIAAASPNQILKPTGCFAETLSIRPRSGSNPGLPCPTYDYFGRACPWVFFRVKSRYFWTIPRASLAFAFHITAATYTNGARTRSR
jgi:hypothetical protein